MADALMASSLVSAYKALLRDETALVAAFGDDGVFVPLPAGVDVAESRVMPGRWALDLVLPTEGGLVISTWDRLQEVGGARALVHLKADPATPVVMQFLDARAEHGVFFGFFQRAEGAGGLDAEVVAASAPVAPRLAVMRKNELATMVHVDEATTRMFGWTAEELLGRRTLELIHPDDHERAINSWMETLSAPGQTHRVRFRNQTKDGRWLWIECTNHNYLDDPERGYVVAENIDISDEMAAQEALRQREQLLHRIAQSIPIGLVQIDAEREIVFANDRSEEILGLKPQQTIDEQLVGLVEDPEALDRALHAVLDGIDGEMEVRVERPDTFEVRTCRLALNSLTDGSGGTTGAILCLSDITDAARMRTELEHRATFDPLTRCYNRASVMSALAGALGQTTSGTAVVFVDLDHFKSINDSLGHAVGDELLSIVADRMRRSVRGQDVVGRIGGDEFLVVCPNVEDEAAAMLVGRRIVAANNQPVIIAGRNFDVRTSVGVAFTRGGGNTADGLIAEADAAMYEAKRSGGGRLVLLPTTGTATPA